jgi:hypothetical protein
MGRARDRCALDEYAASRSLRDPAQRHRTRANVRASAFIGEPKTVESYRYVPLIAKLETELRAWARSEAIPLAGWLFPASRSECPLRSNNELSQQQKHYSGQD